MALPVPLTRAVSRPFWDGLRAGEIRLQRCADCAKWIFYPRGFCPGCGSTDLVWHASSGRASLYSFTLAVAPVSRSIRQEEPLAIGIAELAEGPRLPVVLVGIPTSALRIGMALRPVVDKTAEDGQALCFTAALDIPGAESG